MASTGTGGHFLDYPSDYSDLRPIGTPQSISVHVRWKLNLIFKLEVHVLEVMHFSDAMPPMSRRETCICLC